jgi:hypothetical protein
MVRVILLAFFYGVVTSNATNVGDDGTRGEDLEGLKPEVRGYVCGVQNVLDTIVKMHPELSKMPLARFDCSEVYKRLSGIGVPLFGQEK